MQTAAGSLLDICYQIKATAAADSPFLLADLQPCSVLFRKQQYIKLQKIFGIFKAMLLCVFCTFPPRDAVVFFMMHSKSFLFAFCGQQEFTWISIWQAEGEDEEDQTLSARQKTNRPMTDLASRPFQPDPTNPSTNILQCSGAPRWSDSRL